MSGEIIYKARKSQFSGVVIFVTHEGFILVAGVLSSGNWAFAAENLPVRGFGSPTGRLLPWCVVPATFCFNFELIVVYINVNCMGAVSGPIKKLASERQRSGRVKKKRDSGRESHKPQATSGKAKKSA